MLSGSAQAPKAIKAIEGARNIFMTLFMASIGLMMSPAFLWEHKIILACSLLAVISIKTAVISTIVRIFGFNVGTSLLVDLEIICTVSNE